MRPRVLCEPRDSLQHKPRTVVRRQAAESLGAANFFRSGHEEPQLQHRNELANHTERHLQGQGRASTLRQKGHDDRGNEVQPRRLFVPLRWLPSSTDHAFQGRHRTQHEDLRLAILGDARDCKKDMLQHRPRCDSRPCERGHKPLRHSALTDSTRSSRRDSNAANGSCGLRCFRGLSSQRLRQSRLRLPIHRCLQAKSVDAAATHPFVWTPRCCHSRAQNLHIC
mmetsp:Transcript_47383/g.112694  ORF Transcript_47383/g.112694 Transcript_47383/m.112694 type:complete len:224 (-) Transcript_47383:348-1019(-)